MKILKFNELKLSTYSKVSDRLRSMGHKNRSDKMKDYIEYLKNKKEIEALEKNISFLKEYGSFKLVLKTRNGSIEGNFYISTDVYDRDYFYQQYDDLLEGHTNKLVLGLELGIIPADEETKDKFSNLKDIENVKEMTYDGIYWCSSIGVVIMSEGDNSINPSGEYFFDSRDINEFKFSNRREAHRFRTLLYNSFLGKNEYGKYTYQTSLYDTLNKIFNSDKLDKKIFNNESFGKVADGIKRLSLNKLYSN